MWLVEQDPLQKNFRKAIMYEEYSTQDFRYFERFHSRNDLLDLQLCHEYQLVWVQQELQNMLRNKSR